MRTNVDRTVPSMVKSDQKRYKQVLFNLIGNAVKFTFSGFIAVHVSFKSRKLITDVQDTGLGIKQDAQEKLF